MIGFMFVISIEVKWEGKHVVDAWALDKTSFCKQLDYTMASNKGL